MSYSKVCCLISEIGDFLNILLLTSTLILLWSEHILCMIWLLDLYGDLFWSLAYGPGENTTCTWKECFLQLLGEMPYKDWVWHPPLGLSFSLCCGHSPLPTWALTSHAANSLALGSLTIVTDGQQLVLWSCQHYLKAVGLAETCEALPELPMCIIQLCLLELCCTWTIHIPYPVQDWGTRSPSCWGVLEAGRTHLVSLWESLSAKELIEQEFRVSEWNNFYKFYRKWEINEGQGRWGPQYHISFISQQLYWDIIYMP